MSRSVPSPEVTSAASRTVGVAALVATLVTGCGATDDELVVFAASSLTEAFTELAEAFEADGGGDVTTSFAASSAIVAQLDEGAPADVVATADVDTMDRIGVDRLATGPEVFATNRAEIVVEPGNPFDVTSVADLADPDLVLVVCAPEVPCGTYAADAFDRAGIRPTPDSFEANVKSVVAKVALGEADAGIAYATDVIAADGAVEGVAIPDDAVVTARYPIAVTRRAAGDPTAAAFVAFVLGDEGRRILAEHGFGAP